MKPSFGPRSCRRLSNLSTSIDLATDRGWISVELVSINVELVSTSCGVVAQNKHTSETTFRAMDWTKISRTCIARRNSKTSWAPKLCDLHAERGLNRCETVSRRTGVDKNQSNRYGAKRRSSPWHSRASSSTFVGVFFCSSVLGSFSSTSEVLNM